ncbi:family 20 glycosylhydrolase [Chondrinema litorale]|uniref:family 20 glycosylhydrolase n=1 Tax=Chondrinema litorale TaxID=2994555 RepID=UPI00254298F7|nr:family 20 glycosylhydrolase [Chondrinema litorale]UZR99266.1 carbohydate-binding domain-containing protein [Chondrinema litorale]
MDDLKISWELQENNVGGKNIYKAAFTFVNESGADFPAKDWALYFNMLPLDIHVDANSPLQIERINGDFYRVVPTSNFTGVAAGDSAQLIYEAEAWIIKESDAPCGLYFTLDNEATIKVVNNYQVLPYERTEQLTKGEAGTLPVPTAQTIYEENEKYKGIDEKDIPPFIPTPVSYTYKNDILSFDAGITIFYASEDLKREADFLAEGLAKVLGSKPKTSADAPSGDKNITLAVKSQNVNGKTEDAYQLEVSATKGVSIEATNPAGVFYGIQSLIGMIPPTELKDKPSAIKLKEITVKDAPAFDYRGLHLDVSRNFHTKEAVLQLLDLMAFYKLNKFHFHLTDDEGWRLEIKSLPELTAYGSKRGHTLDEAEHLYPSYGSGPYEELPGSGFYTQEEFIEILKYATERHIEVIPELDLPGHARAAIKAMEYRYRKHMSKGDEKGAFAYLLNDEDDTSTYSSAQGYGDNVVCVCRESSFDFLEVVISEVVDMYTAADLKLNILHTGGDEVPAGAWANSPLCQEFLKNSEEYNDPKELSGYFFNRFSEILKKYDVTPAGWEEIALKMRNHGEKHQINEAVDKDGIQVYVWNAIYGGGVEDLPYLLANAGIKTVMSNAPNLYFDFAYSRDPRDRGYYWGGLVSARDSYKMVPYNHFLTAERSVIGKEFDKAELTDGKIKLNNNSQKNIIGIQGQLWTETVKSTDMMQYYYFPKMLGLVERAWVGTPDWANENNPDQQWKDFNKAFGKFTAYVGTHSMPQLDYYWGGINYRIPAPGAIIKDGKLYANNLYTGLEIRFTTDGTEPNENSTLYTEPIAVNGTVKLKAFNNLGNSSFVTTCSK